MSKLEKAVVVTATAKGIVYHTNPKKVIKYKLEIKEDLTVKENKKSMIVEPEKIYLNMVQRQMYRRLMYGMREYDKKQILAMSDKAIRRVESDYKKAKRAIHILKAKKCYHAETKLISVIFNRKDLGKYDYDWYIDLPKHYTLRKLGIGTKDIIDDFIQRKLLPQNFYELSPENVEL